jgi:hypothetical protein
LTEVEIETEGKSNVLVLMANHYHLVVKTLKANLWDKDQRQEKEGRKLREEMT